MTTEAAIIKILSFTTTSDLFVCSLGRTAETTFSYIENTDRVLFVDCLGATIGLGVGIALANNKTSVYAFETDGSFFYDMTILNSIHKLRDQLLNFHPIIFDNEVLESAGGMPSASLDFSWGDIAKAWDLPLVVVSDEESLNSFFVSNSIHSPSLLVIKVDNSQVPERCTKDIDGIESRYRFKRFLNTKVRKGIIRPCTKN